MCIKMKKTILLMVIVVIITTLVSIGVGCKEAVSETEEETTQAAEETTQAAEETTQAAEETTEVLSFKEEIVCTNPVAPKNLDPLVYDAGGGDLTYSHLFFDNLIEFRDGKFVPVLAKSYTISDDNLSIIFELRNEDIKFHDGTDFNAEAVKWSLDRARTNEKSVFLKSLSSIEDVIVIDDYKVEIKLNRIDPGIVGLLASTGAGCIVSPTAGEEYGEDFGLHPVGTGPYMLDKFVDGESVSGVRNPDYWVVDDEGIQLPYSDKFTVKFIKDAAVLMLGLKSGDVDIAVSSDPKTFVEAENDENLQAIKSGAGYPQYMPFNVTKEPLNNEKLRQAVSASIDRETLVEIITLGYGEVNPTVIGPADWSFNPDLETPYVYNPELAKQLLAEAGYEDGIELTLSIINRDPDVRVAEFIAGSIEEFGITLNVEILERQAWIDKVLSYNYEMAICWGDTPRSDPKYIYEDFYGKDAIYNWAGQSDQEIFDAIEKASLSNDMDERYALYSKAQQLLLDHAYYSYLFYKSDQFLTSTKVIDVPVVNAKWRLDEIKVIE
jgi:peptide/nickel transport system substrate-binding protein